MRENSKSALPRLFSGTALNFLALSPVMAQEPEGAFTLDPIVVQQRDSQGDAADRATAVYVSDAELERARMGDARDLFSGIASVSVGSGIPMSQKIFVNGIDIVNMTTTVDGAMQNNRTFHHSSATVIDPGLLKFVRVDPGIAAADAGPNAVAGAVVMETIDAADFLDPGENFGGTARLSFNDNGDTFGGALTLVGRHQGFEILAYGRNIQGDDYTDGGGNTIEGSAADMQSGLLKVAYESETGHRFELSGQRIIDDALRPWRADMTDLTGADSGTRVYDTERSTYAFTYEFLDGTEMFNPKFNLGYSEAIVNVADPYGSESNANTLSARLENTFNLSDGNTITAGIDYYDKQSDYDDAFDTGLNENAQNVGLFAQGRFELDKWKLSAGLRYDMQDFEGANGWTYEVSGWSGNASAAYYFTDVFSVRAGYSSVFGGLMLEDSYQFWGPVYDSWDYEDLEPSRSENYAIGFDWFQSGGFTFGGELFKTRIENARHLGETHDIQSAGFNLAAAYDWGDGSMRLTYSDSEVTSDGEAEDSYILRGYGTPVGRIMAFQVQQAVPEWDMLFGGSLDVAWDQDAAGTWADADLEGYEVVDLFAEWTPSSLGGLTVRSEILNATDAEYADRASYGGDFTDVVQMNEPGRSFRVEAIARF